METSGKWTTITTNVDFDYKTQHYERSVLIKKYPYNVTNYEIYDELVKENLLDEIIDKL